MTPTVLVADRETADFFEAAVKHGGAARDPKAVANWLMGDLSASANAQNLPVSEAGLSSAALATLVDLIGEGVISGKIAKDLLVMLLGPDKGADPRAFVEARGLRQVTDTGAIERAVERRSPPIPTRPSRRKASPACSAGSSAR